MKLIALPEPRPCTDMKKMTIMTMMVTMMVKMTQNKENRPCYHTCSYFFKGNKMRSGIEYDVHPEEHCCRNSKEKKKAWVFVAALKSYIRHPTAKEIRQASKAYELPVFDF